MEVIVKKITKVDHERIKASAQIELKDILTIDGIKVIAGDKGTYCVPPNQSYMDGGIRKWMNILFFERNLWREVQEKILKKYEEEILDGEKKTVSNNAL